MDRFPTRPDDRGVAGAEKEPYTEAALDAELAAQLVHLETNYKRALERKNRGEIARKKATLEYVTGSPISAFSHFQNNFYGRMPGGLGRVTLEHLEQEAADDPGDLIPMIEMLVKQYADFDAVLKEVGADPELVARAKQRENVSDPAVSALLRKVYIGMRNRGYTHEELYS